MEKREFSFKSTQTLYRKIADGLIRQNFTVPAINIRALTFDIARAIFRVAKKTKTSAFIIELSRTEMDYTKQPPKEYARNIARAAEKENWDGPVFLQADHFVLKDSSEKEIKNLKGLVKSSMKSGFLNMDIDCSCLDLFKNAEKTIEMIEFIRKNQRKGIEVSIGAEIDKIGFKNTKPEELANYLSLIKNKTDSRGLSGIIKVACQTGTHHGGIVLKTGEIENIELDFENIKELSKIAKSFSMAGIVQHGASTLNQSCFKKFVEAGVLEIHLSTEFQNIIFDNPGFPEKLKSKIYEWLLDNFKQERGKYESDEQFFYKTRKRGLGKFEKDILNMSENSKSMILQEIEDKLELFFRELNVFNTQDLIKQIYGNKK